MKGPKDTSSGGLPEEHDASYRRLFSHAALMESLLRRFAARDWADQLDFTTLEPVKTQFVGPENRRRDSDPVWRLRLRGAGEWFYIYVQVEFQSTPDRFMALRALTYLCLLYDDLVRRRELTESGKLPPVLPIVIYNGQAPWRKPVRLEELVEEAPESLRAFLPRFQYLLIDEGCLTPEDLEPLDNPVSALFTLEQAKTQEGVYRGLQAVLDSTRSETLRSVREDMLTWLRRSLLEARFSETFAVEALKHLENPKMLTETVKEWLAQDRAEGLKEGLETGHEQGLQEGLVQGLEQGRVQGLQQGRTDGLRRAVQLQLELKFPGSAPGYRDRLAGADEPALLRWAERLVTADRPEDVFQD